LVSGSPVWRGFLEIGSELELEINAVHTLPCKAIFRAKIETGFRKIRSLPDSPGISYTCNKYLSPIIRVIGEKPEHIDFLDTMRFDRKLLDEDMKQGIRKIVTEPYVYPSRRRLNLARCKQDKEENVLYLGEFRVRRDTKETLWICPDRNCQQSVEILDWQINCKGIELVSKPDNTYAITYNSPLDTCSLLFHVGSRHYRVLLRAV